MKLSHVIFYVKDVAASLDFYEQAFGFKTKMVTPEKDYGELDAGGFTLGFIVHSLAEQNLRDGYQKADPQKTPFGSEITFECEDIKADYDKAISAGAIAVEMPMEKEWGQTIAYIRDIDGHLIEMGSIMKN